MKKNVMFLVVDSLSREYTENFPLENGNFFEYLDKHSLCASNMYATAPFTESALEGMWNQKSPLDTFWGNRLQPVCRNSIFSIFQKAGYEVYFTDHTSVEEYAMDYPEPDRKKAERAARNRIARLLPQVKYYLNKVNTHMNGKTAVTNILDIVFDAVFQLDVAGNGDAVREAELYTADKDKYYGNLEKWKDSHPVFGILEGIHDTDKAQKDSTGYPPMQEELQLAQEIADRNGELLKEYNREIPNGGWLAEQNLSGLVYNRCVWSNANILPLIRQCRSSAPDLGIHRGIAECGIYEFVEKKRGQIKKPYFAYFHEFSFHYPEVFLQACQNEKKYKDALEKALGLLPRLRIKNKISVLKALSLIFVNDWLSELVTYLEEKGVLEDTCLVITSDHGISNFMYPLDRDYRWMFYKENFHVPFWILGSGIEARTYDTLCLSKCIVPTLEELCGIGGTVQKDSLFAMDREYILTEWMNGIPDIEKEYVKFGYRNRRISLTFCVRLNQIFGSGRILTLFDLERDGREYHDLSKSYKGSEICAEVERAMEVIRERFLELQKDNLVFGCTQAWEQMEQDTEIVWLDVEPAPDLFRCGIAVYGTDSVTDAFYQRYGRSLSVRYAVDDTAIDDWYLGKPVCRSLETADEKNVAYVIACEDEMGAWFHLYQCGVRKVYVFTGKKSSYGM